MNIERQYKPIEPPKNKIGRYIRTFNYAFIHAGFRLNNYKERGFIQ